MNWNKKRAQTRNDYGEYVRKMEKKLCGETKSGLAVPLTNQWHPTGNRVDLLRLYIQWIIDDDLYCFNRCELPNCFPLSAIMRKYSLNWWSSTCKAITDRYFHILTRCSHIFFRLWFWTSTTTTNNILWQ